MAALGDVAQYETLPLRRKIIGRPIRLVVPLLKTKFYDEVYSQVATVEILCRQALDGDIVAERAVLPFLRDCITEGIGVINARQGRPAIIMESETYYGIPGEAIIKALTGEQAAYRGIGLSGTIELIKQETQ